MKNFIIQKSISPISTCEGSASSTPISFIDSPCSRVNVEEVEEWWMSAHFRKSEMLTVKDCLEMEYLAELASIERELMNEIDNNNNIVYDDDGDVVMQDFEQREDNAEAVEEQREDNAFYLTAKKWEDNAVYLQRA